MGPNRARRSSRGWSLHGHGAWRGAEVSLSRAGVTGDAVTSRYWQLGARRALHGLVCALTIRYGAMCITRGAAYEILKSVQVAVCDK
jgi:hypothetical protein